MLVLIEWAKIILKPGTYTESFRWLNKPSVLRPSVHSKSTCPMSRKINNEVEHIVE
jgi:hypothetical protein